MKSLLATCLLLAALSAPAVENPAPSPGGSVRGTVLEAKEVEGYTYLRLKTASGETWAAVDRTTLKVGSDVTLENVMVMHDFKSRALNQTFPTILFGNLSGAAAHAGGHGAAAAVSDLNDVKVAKAGGADGRTVAEIVTGAAKLKDKRVAVRGKVVKYNPGIMGKNWLHLRDGSGSADAGSNDILVTTSEAATLGEVVTAKGVVRTDKDFGSGYAYKVLLEEATLAR